MKYRSSWIRMTRKLPPLRLVQQAMKLKTKKKNSWTIKLKKSSPFLWRSTWPSEITISRSSHRATWILSKNGTQPWFAKHYTQKTKKWWCSTWPSDSNLIRTSPGMLCANSAYQSGSKTSLNWKSTLSSWLRLNIVIMRDERRCARQITQPSGTPYSGKRACCRTCILSKLVKKSLRSSLPRTSHRKRQELSLRRTAWRSSQNRRTTLRAASFY